MDAMKQLLQLLLGDYSFYHIYSRAIANGEAQAPAVEGLRFARVDRAQTVVSPDTLIREQESYFGADTYAYACLEGERIVALCFFWYGDRYRTRNFWPLAEQEAKLVQIVTLPEQRGKGIASALILYACGDMRHQGFLRLYARIWHSNGSSLRAFQRAGWSHIATVIEVFPFRRKRPLRFTRRIA